VPVDEIRWTLGEPPDPLEAIDLLALDDEELLAYARGLQYETAWLRALLHEALTVIQLTTIQARRYRARIESLVDQLRQLARKRGDGPHPESV
jgi:hypothetical protein